MLAAPVSVATKIQELGNEIFKIKNASHLQALNLDLDSPRLKKAMVNLGVVAKEMKLL